MEHDTTVEATLALTNEDIDERFELDAERVIRWKRVSAKGLPRWCAAKAEEINRKAGEEVRFFTHTNGSQIVKLYGSTVTEARVRKVLQRQTAKDVGRDLVLREQRAERAERAEAERQEPAKSAHAAAAQPQAAKAKAWSDPLDPKPADGTPEWNDWALREHDRMKAYMQRQKEAGNG